MEEIRINLLSDFFFFFSTQELPFTVFTSCEVNWGFLKMKSQWLFLCHFWPVEYSFSFLRFFFLSLFIYLEKERECMSEVEAKREGRQRVLNRLQLVSTEPDVGLELTNGEIVSGFLSGNQELDA